MTALRRSALGAGAAVFTFALAACGGQTEQPSAGQGQAPPAPAPAPEPAAPMQQGMTTASDVFGPGCAQVPTDPANPGSVQGMIDDPVGTAASNNPLLTKLTAAVTSAGLVDTLNKSDAQYTVFAPADPAFDAIPPEQLQAMLTDPAQKEALTSTLTYHVVPQRMTADDLAKAGSVDTVQGGQIKIEGSGDQLKVNGAGVLCGNVPTANATVFVVDQVLMPAK
ncbi:fasciclin domain-containing protein [Saccharopolyspora endophytica]|uniref:Fasciclin domain-containing protein n=1 Tax=Saccharopolyspora endophytica TaxID=543886 RepID=A0ABS5DFE5_9PSEU|nr:fasciclin domain-containing protein [Saccharopolyspora endophytica]MBQ0925010.1 fasciclin domain-containing protein [Saccharopolyspora endophytica]